MKLRRTLNFHSLRKGKVRMTWNKYNLYNLYNAEFKIPNFIKRTFFQQKWSAKALTRAYHGEHIKEQKWTRMFDRRLRSVVDMNPVYMALNDGAEQATGRGSGLDRPLSEDASPYRHDEARRSEAQRSWALRGGRVMNTFEQLVDKDEFPGAPAKKRRRHIREEGEVELTMPGGGELATVRDTNVQMYQDAKTPYMNMAFAPIERRIDVAIFRAMFASSARQARNMVIHGKVKINGQPMNHATYLLNPGDMFQVDPEAVMYATGMHKAKAPPKKADEGTEEGEKKAKKTKKAKSETTTEDAGAEGENKAAAAPEADEGSLEPAESAAAYEKLQKRLKALALEVHGVLHNDRRGFMGVKQKQRLRGFVKEAKRIQAKLGRKRKDGDEAVEQTLADDDVTTLIKQTLKDMVAVDDNFAQRAETSGIVTMEEAAEAKKAAGVADGSEEDEEPDEDRQVQRGMLSSQAEEKLRKLIKEDEDNPVDPSKPYLTPWQPRPYMSAFAFIPRYLEVNPNICAAVYLRHPVARQGMAEIPSPFPPSVQELAYNWYLRRR